MKEFRPNWDREYLMKRMGDLSQLAGARRCVLTDGKAQGVEAVDVRTGTGFQYTVLPGRGMDIAWAGYKGVPLSYIAKNGIVGPAYYESDGMNWLRNFFAGLLTTCGLSNVGEPAADVHTVIGEQRFGLHGRISNMAAGDVGVGGRWVGREYVMSVSGFMRESQLHGENLVLRRTVESRLGQSFLILHDEVVNESFAPQPVMLLYHINAGYPLLDERSRLICRTLAVSPASDIAGVELASHAVMGPPVNGAAERLYFHDLAADARGKCSVALVNDRLALGLFVRFEKGQLPYFSEWKQLGEAEYALGMEPGNCLPLGRNAMDERCGLQRLAPGESKHVDIEIGVLDGPEEIGKFTDSVL